MYVKTYQPCDVFAFWRKIQSGTPIEYDFKYITIEKRGMLQFMIYIHRTKFYRPRGNKVEEFYEHFIHNKGSRFDSFFVLLNKEKRIESRLHQNEITGDVFETIDSMYSTIPVEYNSNLLLEKIKHLDDHKDYKIWVKKLKVQRLKELFDEEE